jgi:hypothetical protein
MVLPEVTAAVGGEMHSVTGEEKVMGCGAEKEGRWLASPLYTA